MLTQNSRVLLYTDQVYVFRPMYSYTSLLQPEFAHLLAHPYYSLGDSLPRLPAYFRHQLSREGLLENGERGATCVEEASRCQCPSPMPPNHLPGLNNDGHALRRSAKPAVVVGTRAASSLPRIAGVKKVSSSSSTGDFLHRSELFYCFKCLPCTLCCAAHIIKTAPAALASSRLTHPDTTTTQLLRRCQRQRQPSVHLRPLELKQRPGGIIARPSAHAIHGSRMAMTKELEIGNSKRPVIKMLSP
jgi:hypothetical protein